MNVMIENDNIIEIDLYGSRNCIGVVSKKYMDMKKSAELATNKAEEFFNLKEKYFEKFDKILLDVPCMGTGVLKRKPDIKWQRKKEDLENLKKVQKAILENCSKYLKKGGTMVYSTCSILKSENEAESSITPPHVYNYLCDKQCWINSM